MNFAKAIQFVLNGSMVYRKGWGGEGVFVFLVPGSTFNVSRPPLEGVFKTGTEVNYCGHVDIKMSDGRIMPWTPSQVDMMSDDWYLVVPGTV